MDTSQASHRQWLQQELRKLPTAEMQSLSSWLQEVLKARLLLEALEGQSLQTQASSTPAAPSAEPREKAEARSPGGAAPEPAPPQKLGNAVVATSTSDSVAPAAAKREDPAPQPMQVEPAASRTASTPEGAKDKQSSNVNAQSQDVGSRPATAPSDPIASRPEARSAEDGTAAKSAVPETSKSKWDVKQDAPTAAAPAVNGTATARVGGPQRGSRSRSPRRQEPPPSKAVVAASESVPQPVHQNSAAPPAPPAAPPAPPAAPAAPPQPAARPSPPPPQKPAPVVQAAAAPASEATPDEESLDKDVTELRSSLWAAFSQANETRSQVTQAEKNCYNVQVQAQQAIQKTDEAMLAVQHWAGMVEQCRMEHVAMQTGFYEPHFQAQSQQRLSTAMQSHNFAVQSSERAQQQRKAAEKAMTKASEELKVRQADVRNIRGELLQVVNAAEAFLRANATSLAQDKAQPLWGLCTRFTQFAQQLGTTQEEAAKKPVAPTVPVQGLAPAQPKQPAAGTPGEALHPLADYQQRVMVVEESKAGFEPMDLFGDEDHDLQSSAPPMLCPFLESGNCEAGDACQFSHERPAAVEASAPKSAEARKAELAKYKEKLLSEASYLEAVFGKKKQEG